MSDQRPKKRPFAFNLVVLITTLVGLLFCAGVEFPIELAIYLSLGWAAFLFETLPKASPIWPAVLLAVKAMIVFTVGLHVFLSWFRAASYSAESPKPRW